MTKDEQIKNMLLNDLNNFNDHLTRITIREYRSALRLVRKLRKKVEKYYG